MSEEQLGNQENEPINNQEIINKIEESEAMNFPKEENIEDKSCKSHKHNKCVIAFGIISLLSFIGVVILLIMMFCCSDKISSYGSNPTSSVPKTIQKGDLKIAYINTDSVLARYDYAKDMEKGLKSFQQQLESNYESQGKKLKSDIENYMKTGEKLTLTDQKKKEEELARRQQEFPMMQQKMMQQLQERQLDDNKKLLNAVYAFIRDYNAKHDKYNIIFSKSFASSTVLYADEGLDITEEIVKGLNEEYKNIKK